MSNSGTVHSPRIGHRQVVYQNRYHHVYRVEADFGEFTKEYFVTDYGKRAGLLVLQGDSVLLVRQYRMLIDRLSWEIPGGKVEDGETSPAAAVRECLEETGLRCRNLKPLLSFQPGLDTLHNPTDLFYTDAFEEANGREPGAREVVSWEWVPLTRCIDMVFQQEIVDSLSVLALLSYQASTRVRPTP